MKILIVAFLSIFVITSCAPRSSQNRYNYTEVGHSVSVQFGTVVASRTIDIAGQNTGTGGMLGAGAGMGLGSMLGGGTGSLWAMGAGALIGAVAGSAAEQGMSNRKGMEYTVTLETGETITIVQEKRDGDVLIQPGSRCMVQRTGEYQRVLPADHLPDTIKRPKNIRVIDD